MSSIWYFCFTRQRQRSPWPGISARPGARRVGRHDPQLDASTPRPRRPASPARASRASRPSGQSPMPKSCDTMRVPGLSSSSRQEVRVQFGQEVHRDHGGGRMIGLEEVLHAELRLVGDALLAPRSFERACTRLRDLDAEARRAELGRGEHDAAVARAEVDHVVAGLHLGHAQHALDDLRRGLHVRHRAVVPAPGLCLPAWAGNASAAPTRNDLSEGQRKNPKR